MRSTVERRLASSRRSALKRLNRYLRSLEEDKIDLIDDRVWRVEASIHQLWRGTRSSRGRYLRSLWLPPNTHLCGDLAYPHPGTGGPPQILMQGPMLQH